jgi:hypothetical protein
MGQAIAKVLSPGGGFRGTAFAVSRDLVLTAFHCIGDRASGKISLPTVSLHFLDGPALTASFHDGNGPLDFALLKLEFPLPENLEPIPIATEAKPHESFRCIGYPAAVQGPDSVTITGEVSNPAGSLFGAPAIELYSKQAAARLELPGMSGGPVLVGNDPEVAVGIIRWNPQPPDGTAQAQGGVVFACPIKNVLEEFPELEVHAVRRMHPKAPLADKSVPGEQQRVRHDYYRHVQLPPKYVPRTDLLAKVRAGLLPESRNVAFILALHGMGGIGKSVMARALCDDPAVKAAFPDGILWATLGKAATDADVVKRMQQWVTALGGTVTENGLSLNFGDAL